MGLMQLMPDTGSLVAKQHGTPLGRKQNLFDAELNVELGTAYLAQLIGRFGSVEQGLVAYNAGPTHARRLLAQAGSRAGSFTGYSRKVISEMGRLKAHNAQELAAK